MSRVRTRRIGCRVVYAAGQGYCSPVRPMHTPHSPTAPDARRDAIAAGWRHALDATTLVGGRADSASTAPQQLWLPLEYSREGLRPLEAGSPRGQCPLGCRAPRRGGARAHTQLRIARACHRPVGGWRAASWRAQLAPRLRMAPAAAANEQTARAHVRLQGSSSAAAVGAGARRATAHSAATRGWCAGSGGLGRCGSSWSLRQTSGSRRLRRQTGKRFEHAAGCEAAAARRSARGGVRARERAGAARG